jgi:hypothetical protein
MSNDDAVAISGMDRLAIDVLATAIMDYHSRDTLRALDALLFIIDPGPTGFAGWCDVLGFGNGDPDDTLRRATDVKRIKIKRPAGDRA